MRIVTGAFLGALMSMAVAATAFAHAHLQKADPPIDAVAATAPAKVTLWFTEHLEPAFSKVQVLDEHDRQVDRGDCHVDPQDPTELTVSLPPLEPGTYKVVWRVVSVDTHVTNGQHVFKVRGP